MDVQQDAATGPAAVEHLWVDLVVRRVDVRRDDCLQVPLQQLGEEGHLEKVGEARTQGDLQRGRVGP